LFSGGRKYNKISCWDIRNTGQILYEVSREANSNQRISFDIHNSGRCLATGSQDGKVLVYELTLGELKQSFEAHKDVVNGCSFHPSLPFLATTSGQRSFDLPLKYQDNPEDGKGKDSRLLIWRDPSWIIPGSEDTFST